MVGGAKAGRATERGGAARRPRRRDRRPRAAASPPLVELGMQWLVVRATTDPVTIAAVLAVPALITGISVARVLAGPDVVRVSRRSLR